MKNKILKTFTAISNTLKRSNFGIFPPEAKFFCCTFLRMPPLVIPGSGTRGGILNFNTPDPRGDETNTIRQAGGSGGGSPPTFVNLPRPNRFSGLLHGHSWPVSSL